MFLNGDEGNFGREETTSLWSTRSDKNSSGSAILRGQI